MSIIKRKAGSEDIVKSVLEFDAVPTDGSPNLVESGAVAQAIGNLGQPLQWKGPATVAELNAGITGIQPGWTYTLTDAGTLTDGSVTVDVGDEVAWTEDDEWFQVGPSLVELKADVVQAKSDIADIQDVVPEEASDSNKLVTKDELDNVQESIQSGFTPKGEISVSDLNDLTTQSNGDQYILTDSGTITDGSVTVEAGDSVAWNSTDSVWYKLNQYALSKYGTDEIKNLPTSITAFRTGDVIPVDGPSGTAKMSKDDLLKEAANSEYNAVLLDRAASENGMSKVKAIVSGSGVQIRINVNLNTDDKLLIRVDGESGIVADNRLNVVSQKNGSTAQLFGTIIKAFGKWYEVSCEADADAIFVQRDTAIGSGDLTMSVIPEKTLFNYLEGQIDDVEGRAFGKIDNISFDLSGAGTGYYYDATGSIVSNVESSYKELTIDEDAAGKNVTVEVGASTVAGGDTRNYVLMRNGSVIRAINNGIIKRDYAGKYTFPERLEEGDVFRCSWKTDNGTPSVYYSIITKSIQETIENAYTIYVAITGDDTNEGSKSSPVKTVSKAVELGAETVIVAGGIYDDDLLDLSKSIHDKITIKGARGESVIFKKSQSLILADGSEELVSGYTKVYSAHLESAPAITGTRGWLFFDGLDYARTEIQPSEIHPLQRGKFYRCDCTRITKTTANTLSDALAEIEAETTDYKWWYDSDTKTLYFNRAGSTETYPIYNGGNNSNYLKTRTDQSVVLSNIEFRYGCVNLKFLNIAELYNVASKYVNASGAFIYDNSIAVTFDHCEAASCYYSENGDGFNGHATAGVNPGSKYCQATLRHCWAHDNNDDGYSDHEYAEATIEGGLFEYNNKGGVTPSYGSHCVCRDVLSRKNYNGFYYTGTASEGNAGQMICFNCLSENNFRGNSTNTGGYKVDGENNYIKLVGCRSIGDTHCVVGWTASATIELIDFGYKDPVGSVTTGTATFVKNNTTIYT